jgi:hypothetical protein
MICNTSEPLDRYREKITDEVFARYGIDIIDRGYEAAQKANDKVAQSILLGSRAMYYLYAGNPEKAKVSFMSRLLYTWLFY